MSYFKVSKMLSDVPIKLVKHSPEILTGLGIAGMIATVVTAVRATPKALTLLEDKRIERENNGEEPALSVKEVIQTTWKCYIPAVVTGSISIACLICANTTNVRRNAALATAYTLSESALKEYREKVVETVGEKKEKTIREAIVEDKIKNNPVNSSEVIVTDKGDTLCYDVVSGRYFKSDKEKIKRAELELNRQMLDEMYISLNEFYYELGLNGTKLGESLGWNIDHEIGRAPRLNSSH